MLSLRCCLILPLVSWLMQEAAWGAPITFEIIPSETVITNQYAGITFTNALALESEISLNEFEFPPHSGRAVATDFGGPLSITLQSAINSFSGFFTYSTRLTVLAYDAANQPLASATSLYSSNLALSGTAGSSPNELIRISSNAPIVRVTIAGSAGGESFAMDDIEAVAVPEPVQSVTIALTLLCFAATGSVLRAGKVK